MKSLLSSSSKWAWSTRLSLWPLFRLLVANVNSVFFQPFMHCDDCALPMSTCNLLSAWSQNDDLFLLRHYGYLGLFSDWVPFLRRYGHPGISYSACVPFIFQSLGPHHLQIAEISYVTEHVIVCKLFLFFMAGIAKGVSRTTAHVVTTECYSGVSALRLVSTRVGVLINIVI